MGEKNTFRSLEVVDDGEIEVTFSTSYLKFTQLHSSQLIIEHPDFNKSVKLQFLNN